MYWIIGIWSIFLFFITMYNFIRYVMFLSKSNDEYIQRRLIKNETTEEMPVNNLANLRPDDLLVLELIKVNTSEYDLVTLIKKLNKVD